MVESGIATGCCNHSSGSNCETTKAAYYAALESGPEELLGRLIERSSIDGEIAKDKKRRLIVVSISWQAVRTDSEQHSDGDTLWKDMVKQEEERLRERDEAIRKMEERDRKRRAKEHREHPKKSKKEEQPKQKKKEESHEGEEEEEEEDYQPVPGKKGEGKMMQKMSDPPNPGQSAIP